jgi:hypothetical protein
LFSGVLLTAATGALAVYFLTRHAPENPDNYQPPPLVFDGPSDQLERTIIVPAFDSPLPEAKSAIWCASFELAWKELTDSVANESIRLDGADDVVQRLNATKIAPGDFTPEVVYAAAGWVRDGIAARIRKEMGLRFPNVRLPSFDEGDEAIAYAYLAASIRFKQPYYDDKIEFHDSGRSTTSVAAFGILKQRSNDDSELRDQAEVLFSDAEFGSHDNFAIDLDRHSTPLQVVVARVPKRASLAETFAEVQNRINQQQATNRGPHTFGRMDELLVPTMHFKIDHRYRELEGKAFANQSLRGALLSRASQSIQFRLDRSGAAMKSEAESIVWKAPRGIFLLNQPYLIYMMKRGANRPLFVMWVDNAELMVK